MIRLLLLLVAVRPDTAATPDQRRSAERDTSGRECPRCAEWNAPQRPFRIVGNSWYVGTRGLGAVLVTSPAGHVLIDGGLPESAPRIIENIESLGFRLRDVKLLINSHAHYDHAGGLAELQRASGARVAAHPWSAGVFATGVLPRSDPQHGTGIPYPPLPRVQHVRDGETVRVGPLALTAHYTAGHTPGGTSWSWTSCERGRCVEVVYADSQNPVSADGFLFSRSATYPSAVRDFERGFATLEALRCDVLLTPHPEFAGILEKAGRGRGRSNPFIQPGGCRRYVDVMRRRLAARLREEAAAPRP